MGGDFCSCLRGVDGGFIAVNQIFVKSIFDEWAAITAIEEAGALGFIFGEEQFGIAGANEPALSVLPMLEFDARIARKRGGNSRNGAAEIFSPGPGIAEPELWKDVERGGLRAAINGGDSNQNVFDVGFGVFDKHVEVAIF